MGKTAPSYRMALEFEFERWKGFKKALTSEEDREAFEELMDMCRNNAMAGGCACNPIIFEPWQCLSCWLNNKSCENSSTSLTRCCDKKSAPKKTIQPPLPIPDRHHPR